MDKEKNYEIIKNSTKRSEEILKILLKSEIEKVKELRNNKSE